MNNHDRELRNHSHVFWVSLLAGTLVRIAKSKTVGEAKTEARGALGELTDSYSGLRGIRSDFRRRWRDTALGKDDDE